MDEERTTGRARAVVLWVAAVFCAALLVPSAASSYDLVRELQNFAKIQERNTQEVLTPSFLLRLEQQNLADVVEMPLVLAGDLERNPLGNLCAHRKNECAGDVRFYDWVDDGYGLRTPVLFTARSGAVISGNVWRTRKGPDKRPAIVITTGSVQAPETLYWGLAATLAKRGYVVLTYDVQGQGRSDTFGAGPDSLEGFPSQLGQPFYDGTEDALDFLLSTPDEPYAEQMSSSCGNANGGAATSHANKQRRREGERDPFTGRRRAEPFNPFWQHVDPDRVGIAGHSLGAAAVSYIGQRDPRVKAIAAWDNLGTPDEGGSACPARPGTREGVPVTKPSIGFSNDYGLVQTPYLSDPNPQSKNAAFAEFKQAGVDSMQVNIRGGTHFEYSFLPGLTANQPLGTATFRGMHVTGWYTAAWMDKYVKCPGAADPGACEERADAALLTDRWRRDAPNRAIDLANDPSMFSFYLRSRFDFTRADGSEAVCDDMRAGCPVMGPDDDPDYPGDYSYIAEANSPDGPVPAAPAFTGTEPASPSGAISPRIKGTAPGAETVRLFTDSGCSGDPAAAGTREEFEADGLGVTVEEGSTTSFWATATDAEGNTSACSTASITYVHDVAGAPDTRIDSGPVGLTTDASPEFAFSSPDAPEAEFECRLDDQEFAACESPRSYSGLADGEHTFRVRAVLDGTPDPSPAAASFTVDATPPPAPALTSTRPASPANENEPSILGAAEPGSLVQLYASLDCSGPATTLTAAELAEGVPQSVADDTSTPFTATATDAAGNTSACSAALTYIEDSTPPDTTIDGGPGGATSSGRASFAFSSPAGDATKFDCRLDEAEWTPCASPVGYRRLGNGTHSFEARAIDGAGNTDESPARMEFAVEEAEEPPKSGCEAPILGTEGADELTGSAYSDRIRGLGGADTIDALGGDDCVNGGGGRDRITGGPGADVLRGGSGRDVIKGGPGPDRVGGGKGNDRIDARGGGRDVIACGPGRDRVRADRADEIRGGCERVVVAAH